MQNTQRNHLDVIMELVNLHIEAEKENGTTVKSDEIGEIFLKYYKLYRTRDSNR